MNMLNECLGVSYTLTTAIGAAIDNSIFTADLTSETLDIYSDDTSQAGIYDFQMLVAYSNIPSVTVTIQFSVELIDCNTSSFQLDSTDWQDEEYTVNEDTKVLTWT